MTTSFMKYNLIERPDGYIIEEQYSCRDLFDFTAFQSTTAKGIVENLIFSIENRLILHSVPCNCFQKSPLSKHQRLSVEIIALRKVTTKANFVNDYQENNLIQ